MNRKWAFVLGLVIGLVFVVSFHKVWIHFRTVQINSDNNSMVEAIKGKEYDAIYFEHSSVRIENRVLIVRPICDGTTDL